MPGWHSGEADRPAGPVVSIRKSASKLRRERVRELRAFANVWRAGSPKGTEADVDAAPTHRFAKRKATFCDWRASARSARRVVGLLLGREQVVPSPVGLCRAICARCWRSRMRWSAGPCLPEGRLPERVRSTLRDGRCAAAIAKASVRVAVFLARA